jgi:DNA repair exonuclease SbcCD ATPase subunit
VSDKFVVTVKDFQSIHSANLDFPTGLTIITGKTNGGKTAIFRAIDSALFNKGDDSMISAGKRYSGVSIDNGKHKMMFMRDSVGKNEKTAYQFDGGTVQKKVGRNQLPEVSENFNIRDVRMQNGTKMKINFGIRMINLF